MDRIQLIVNRVQVTKHSDVNKLQLYIYPISVNELSPLNIKIGKVSFSQSFCLSYRCNVLLTFILEVMKNSGFTVPQMDYRLLVNGHLVDMKERLEDVGCVENSEIIVEAANGDSLDDVFCVGNSIVKEESKNQETLSVESVKPSVVQPEVNQAIQAEAKLKPQNEPMVVTRRLNAPVTEARLSGSMTEVRQSAESTESSDRNVMDDPFVSSRQRKQRRVTESSAEDPQSPMKEESKQMEVPNTVKEALKEMSAGLAEDSAEYRRVATLQEFVTGTTRQLSDIYAEYLRLK